MEDMFSRLKDTLDFGSIALMRVHPKENFGLDVVPIAIGRKAPCPWSTDYAKDGMFDQGDIMVFIYEFEQPAVGEFAMPNLLLGDETRAVPLKCLAGVGQSILGYMERVEDPDVDSVSNMRCRLRPGVVEEARSNLVRMSVDPTSAFQGINVVPLSESDDKWAPIQQSLFAVGTVIRKGFVAPSWGSEKAWSGKKKFDATVIDIKTCRKERRHYYRLRWSGKARTLILANVPMDVDQGFIQKYFLKPPV